MSCQKFRLTPLVCASALLLASGSAAQALAQSDPRFAALQDQVNKAINVRDCAIVQFQIGEDAQQPMQVKVPIDGFLWNFDLVPHSVRGPNFEVLEQRADGQIYSLKASPEVTVRGTIAGQPGSIVAGGILADGLHAHAIFSDNSSRWIQPVSKLVPGAPADLYAIYSHEDVLQGDWRCGSESHAPEQQDGPPISNRGGTLFTAQLSTDADFEFFSRHGGTAAVNSRISTLVNIMNVQYERETDITHTLATMLVRTAEPDPYASSDAGTLLSTFTNDWNANRPNSGDIRQLFTGKDVNGGTIGFAFIRVVCSTNAYGIVQSDFNNNLASATDLSAHEAGHNWGADHCTCSGNGNTVSTMNPFITSINRFAFSNDINTIGQIVSHRNSRTCLSTGGGGLDPRNDLCGNAVPIGPNTLIGWNNSGAGTDGPAACGSIGSDIWYTYVAPCDGPVSVNTCGSNHDTVLAVYTGGCTALTQVGCNDDTACPGGSIRQSIVPFTAIRGTTYRIRVGGFLAAIGDGLIIVSQSCPPPFNNNCANATVIGQGNTPFSTAGADTDGPIELNACNNAGNAQLRNDIWFRHTAQCNGTIRIGTCSADFDTKLAVYAACPTGINQAIACNDDNGPLCAGTPASLSFLATFGTTYLIRLGAFSDATGTGTLTLGNLGCETPANDLCASAINVSAGGIFAGRTSGAGTEGSASCASNSNDVWFRFTAPPFAGILSVNTCGTHDADNDDAGIDTVLSLHSGCTGTTANQLACNDDWPSSGIPNVCSGLDISILRDSAVQIGMTPGQSVIIRVATFGSVTQGGTFRLNVGYSTASGACCCGSTCSITAPAACTGSFQGAAACNAPGNNLAPCCRADFNHVGGVTVQDIFDFLAAYFSANTCSDANQSGAVTVQDIFDFLAAYFQGC